MPELPDVEVFRQYVESTSLHRSIEEIQIPSSDMFDAVSASRLKRSWATIKSALMNQKMIAGIGNVYSDEILFQAGIPPAIKAGRLSGGDLGDLEALYSSMELVLEAAIDARADPHRLPSSFIIPHRRGDGKCPKCGMDIAKKESEVELPIIVLGASSIERLEWSHEHDTY